jgi:hypothetical protein
MAYDSYLQIPKLCLSEMLVFSMTVSQVLCRTISASEFSNAALLFEILTRYCSLPFTSFNFSALALYMKSLRYLFSHI